MTAEVHFDMSLNWFINQQSLHSQMPLRNVLRYNDTDIGFISIIIAKDVS